MFDAATFGTSANPPSAYMFVRPTADALVGFEFLRSDADSQRDAEHVFDPVCAGIL